MLSSKKAAFEALLDLRLEFRVKASQGCLVTPLTVSEGLNTFPLFSLLKCSPFQSRWPYFINLFLLGVSFCLKLMISLSCLQTLAQRKFVLLSIYCNVLILLCKVLLDDLCYDLALHE